MGRILNAVIHSTSYNQNYEFCAQGASATTLNNI
jgi:hypothetical protein